MELINKYRPTKWSEVVGHASVVKSVTGLLENKITKSFIFDGPAGLGKTTFARLIAKDVGCVEPIEVNAADSTGVDDMRDLLASINQLPMRGKSTVYIIDEAHGLTKYAWSSLLKPVEEPPAHVYWVFCTTEGAKIPKAIATRCASYTLKPIKVEVLLDLLEDVVNADRLATPTKVLGLIATSAAGSPRQALSYLAMCHECDTSEAAAKMIRSLSAEEGPAGNMCLALVKGERNWGRLMEYVKELQESGTPGESIRYMVVGYLSKVLINVKDAERAAPLLNVLDAFSTPYPQGAGASAVILSLGRVVLG